MIKHGDRSIGHLLVTSIMGHSGSGDIFPLNLLPSYRAMAKKIRDEKIPVITKSATRYDRKGFYRWYAPWRCIKKIIGEGRVIGLLNSFGLRNKGVQKCAEMILSAINKGFNPIPSYFVELSKGIDIALKEAKEAIAIYKQVLGKHFWALEYNASCPNSGESLEETEHLIIIVARFFLSILPAGVILIVKLSPVHSLELALDLQEAGVHVIHSLNTFPHRVIFPNKISPLAQYGGGGYSGELTFEPAFGINRQLRSELRIPMIMGCGISSIAHVKRYADLINTYSHTNFNKNSICICSIIRTDPKKAYDIIYHTSQLFKRRS